MSLELATSGAPLSQANALVILMHGRGSSGEDIIRIASHLQTSGCAFLAPTAPRNTWYPQRFLVPMEENEPWLTRAVDVIGSVADQAIGQGIPPDRIGILGFSQGACLALEFATRYPRRYAFIAALSGAFMGPLDRPLPNVDLQQTPTLLACADEDGFIPLPHVDRAERHLSTQNTALTRLRFPGDAHTLFPEELDWCQKHLPGG